jgi:hypothetical protein
MKYILILWLALIAFLTVTIAVAENGAAKIIVVRLPLNCQQSSIQSGVPVKRLSDGRVTRVDVCGAADSSDDSFRDIPYELPAGYPQVQ